MPMNLGLGLILGNGAGALSDWCIHRVAAANLISMCTPRLRFDNQTIGSHTFCLQTKVSAGTGFLDCGGVACQLEVRELR